jgi:anti-sigma regulatory factor (Ser/Thr protein kinase)
VPDSLVRRLRLPPTTTSPAAARGAVASLLGAAGLADLHDEALLLTSELVTNGVVHARSELELEIVAGTDGVQVTVTDFAPMPALALEAALRPELFPAAPSQVAIAEGGRGLLLVSRFASRWGISHERTGRAVWFQLDRTPVAGASPSDRPDERALEMAHPDLAVLLRAVLTTDVTPSLPDLLARVAVGLAAATATISLDRADGLGSHVIYRHGGTTTSASGPTLRVSLPVGRPWTAELVATGVRGPHARTLAELAASPLALLLENQRLIEAHEEGRAWLLFLAEAGELLAQSMNVDLAVALIPQLVVPRLGRWCAVHLLDEYGELRPAATAHADEAASAGLADRVSRALAEEPYALTVETAVALGPPTYGLCVPLQLGGVRLGTLTVGRRGEAAHTPDELAVAQDLSHRASVAIDSARLRAARP